jgi:RHS repeat-associated protein
MTADQAATSLLYSGEFTDAATGQQYLRARFYDPSTGRLNRLDPFAGNMNDPQSLHKYAYVHGDPIQNIDPSGMISLGEVSSSIRIGLGNAGQFLSSVGQVFTAVDRVQAAIDLVQSLSTLTNGRRRQTGTNRDTHPSVRPRTPAADG